MRGNFASLYVKAMKMKGCFLICMLSLFSYALTAQQAEEQTGEDAWYEVTGTVTDEFGEPLAGAAVLIRNQPVSS